MLHALVGHATSEAEPVLSAVVSGTIANQFMGWDAQKSFRKNSDSPTYNHFGLPLALFTLILLQGTVFVLE